MYIYIFLFCFLHLIFLVYNNNSDFLVVVVVVANKQRKKYKECLTLTLWIHKVMWRFFLCEKKKVFCVLLTHSHITELCQIV